MSSVVLDASAVLAYVLSEAGSAVVGERMNGDNVGGELFRSAQEVAIERGGSTDVIADLFDRSEVEVIPFDEEQAVVAANLFATTSEQGLSFADRACLALGIQRGAAVLTAEHRMGEARVPVKVILIRQRTKAKVTPH